MNCANLKLLTILQKHCCELEVMETGEHYLHTEEQLKYLNSGYTNILINKLQFILNLLEKNGEYIN